MRLSAGLSLVAAPDLCQLTSGEMAEQDGSDASPPESQGEFVRTRSNFCVWTHSIQTSVEPVAVCDVFVRVFSTGLQGESGHRAGWSWV